MLTDIRTKIRALVQDYLQYDNETFVYETSAILTMSESNLSSVRYIEKNGVLLSPSKWTYSSTYNQVTVTETLVAGDILTVYYSYYKYSDTELNEYVRASLSWIGIYGGLDTTYELIDTTIYPTLSPNQENIVAIIAATIINPEYSEYRGQNISVRYPRNMCKEERIKTIVGEFKYGKGYSGVIQYDETCSF